MATDENLGFLPVSWSSQDRKALRTEGDQAAHVDGVGCPTVVIGCCERVAVLRRSKRHPMD